MGSLEELDEMRYVALVQNFLQTEGGQKSLRKYRKGQYFQSKESRKKFELIKLVPKSKSSEFDLRPNMTQEDVFLLSVQGMKDRS